MGRVLGNLVHGSDRDYSWCCSISTSMAEIFAVLAITVIFICAQGEGRFLEDPYLWILTGYLTAVRDLEQVS